jgi:hypothetical protein
MEITTDMKTKEIPTFDEWWDSNEKQFILNNSGPKAIARLTWIYCWETACKELEHLTNKT